MKHTLTFLSFILLLSGCATTPNQWTRENKALETTYQTLHAIDLMQTLDIKNHPELHESSWMLGRHPSDASIATWYVSTTYGHALVTSIFESKDLPKWMCRTWQALTIVDVANAVRGNYQLGLKVSF